MGANAGLHFLLQVQNGMSEAELIASAKANGVRLQGISPYYLGNSTPMANTILLGFAYHTPQELHQAAIYWPIWESLNVYIHLISIFKLAYSLFTQSKIFRD